MGWTLVARHRSQLASARRLALKSLESQQSCEGSPIPASGPGLVEATTRSTRPPTCGRTPLPASGPGLWRCPALRASLQAQACLPVVLDDDLPADLRDTRHELLGVAEQRVAPDDDVTLHALQPVR